jgi:hypothetical protein
MTYYVNFRSRSVDGAVIAPSVYQGIADAGPLALTPIAWETVGSLVAGRNVLFAAHGFNVNQDWGARSLGQLEAYLQLTSADVFFGVLWPGDWWLPAVNYPFEGDDAMDCGRRLAGSCRRWMAAAQSFSFISHSLGARLVLEAVRNLHTPARSVCLTAAAINRDCLVSEYAAAAANASEISLLASRDDAVLQVAYQIGDPISVLLHDDHTPFQRALGYEGPPTPAALPVVAPWQIPDQSGYGHGDYLPPGNAIQTPEEAQSAKWLRVADFMTRAYRGVARTWPA